jgi:serine/threonine protein kinase
VCRFHPLFCSADLMTIPSGSDIHQTDAPEVPEGVTAVPLASLPLVAGQQNTIITDNANSADATDVTLSDVVVASADAADVLFGLNGTDSVPGNVMLSHFKVLRRIGAGGMGHVFLAEDVQLRRPVALKVLKPSSANDTTLLARFQNEARCAAMLRPENIAQVYFIGHDQGLHFIACEYVAGRTVRELILEEGPLPIDRVLNYAIQTTLALNHMHASGVIHRDIKPSNIIVSDEGRVKIVDLGLARRDSPDSVCDVTVAGSILGTFDYIAPEQARDPRQADIRSDIYSLGCTMYHMLTGQPPYPEGTAWQKVMDHQGKQAPDPAKINNRVPPELASIVLTMLSTDPADRQQSPIDLLADLTDVAADLGLHGVPADGIVWRDDAGSAVRQQSGALAMLAAVCVVCATALAMHFMPDSSQQPTPAAQNDTEGPSGNDPLVDDTAVPLLASPPPTESAPEEHLSDSIPPFDLPVPPYVVHTPGEQPQSFDSLNQALEFTRSGERTGHEIELNFSGTQPEPIQQLPRLENETVHIFAAEGANPVLEYHGNSEDPRQTSLFRLVNNSSLRIDGVALRLVQDPESKDSRWSLFECAGPAHLDLRECAVQVNVRPGAAAEVCRLNESAVALDDESETTIRLTDVVVSGHTDMFRIASITTARFHLNNCGFAIDGHLFNNLGNSSSMGTRGSLEIDLDDVTAVTGLSAFRIVENESPSRRTTAAMNVHSDACVFASAYGNGVFVESQGPGRPRDLQDLLNWNGQTNLYSGFDEFWQLAASQYDLPAPNGFNVWKQHWNRRQNAGEQNAEQFEWTDAAWLSESADETDLRQFREQWFQIDPKRFDPAAQDLPLAPDRNPPGVIVRRLPKLEHDPQPPQTENRG